MLSSRQISGLVVLSLALLLTACGGNDSPTAPTTPPPQGPADLQKIDLVVGDGPTVVNNKYVAYSYILWLYDPAGTDSKGQLLDSGSSQFRTGTNAVIPGFEQGVLGMNVGGSRRLIIPPNLAYGSSGVSNGYVTIPGNAWLVYEVAILQMVD